MNDLPNVLWASRTTPTTCESPFSLAFGTKAILPPEVVYPTLRVKLYKEEALDKQQYENLDLLEEKCAEAYLITLDYRRGVAMLYNCKVHPRQVERGDLVLRKAEVSDPTRSRGKLAPNWDGPYRVIEVVREGTYILATIVGKQLSRTWHISNLRKKFI
ncbi:hypothetical protein BHE74_00032339 [Ensete ventricosum]|nr:hypothetical protein BHE74_00032339 [Ensete ventricosum]